MASRFIYNRPILHFAVSFCGFDVFVNADYANNADRHARTANAAEYDEISNAADDALDWLGGSGRTSGLLGNGKYCQLCSAIIDKSAE